MANEIEKLLLKDTKYKVLTVFLNIVAWGIFVLAFHYVLMGFGQSGNYLQLFKTISLAAAVFYLNYYLLIPKFLSKRSFSMYAVSMVLMLLLVFLFNWLIETLWAANQQTLFINGGNSSQTNGITPENPLMAHLGIMLLCVISVTISTSIRVTREWFKNENSLKEIENKKLAAELSYLKAQINPHFFFNTLNGIYALARQKSDRTPEVIMMLSVMMRYIIYESSSPKVLLKKELKHIENLIDLQKLRLTEMVRVDFSVEGNPKDIYIEPLLFTVLVENAFKHGIDYSKKNRIKVELKITGDELNFVVSNPVVPVKKIKEIERESGSGIGLENIRKRLELLYPHRHSLTISEYKSVYTVELHLNLDNVYYDEVSNH
ncbi:MAG: sensor histidine kinase [Mangrovibacterium sp.]